MTEAVFKARFGLLATSLRRRPSLAAVPQRIIPPRNKGHYWWTNRTHWSLEFFTAAIVFERIHFVALSPPEICCWPEEKSKDFFSFHPLCHCGTFRALSRFWKLAIFEANVCCVAR